MLGRDPNSLLPALYALGSDCFIGGRIAAALFRVAPIACCARAAQASVPYNHRMRFCQWLIGWFHYDYTTDPGYLREAAWIADFKPGDAKCGQFALEHARVKYAEVIDLVEQMDAKFADLQKTAATLATLLVAAVGAFKLPFGWPAFSLVCFLLAMVFSIISRRAVLRPTQASVRNVLQSGCTDETAGWLAASLHGSIEAHRVLQRWSARNLTLTGALICIGVTAFLPVIWHLR